MRELTDDEKEAAINHFWDCVERAKKMLPCGCCYDLSDDEEETNE